MNKAELVRRVARDTGLTRADALRVIDATLAQVTRALRRGDAVKLVDFGTFEVTHRRARAAHNPHTGAAMKVPARKWPRFSPGKKLKALVR
jgi:DNA-binding protein HU-beta